MEYLTIKHQNLWTYLPCGSFIAASGPFVLLLFLPTRVGIGGSYFFFLSLSSLLSPPEPPPAE